MPLLHLPESISEASDPKRQKPTNNSQNPMGEMNNEFFKKRDTTSGATGMNFLWFHMLTGVQQMGNLMFSGNSCPFCLILMATSNFFFIVDGLVLILGFLESKVGDLPMKECEN